MNDHPVNQKSLTESQDKTLNKRYRRKLHRTKFSFASGGQRSILGSNFIEKISGYYLFGFIRPMKKRNLPFASIRALFA